MIARAFLRYELGRHATTLLLGLLLLAVLPVAQRVITDDFDYWDGAWNVWGAVLALYVLMPLLVLAMAASGWARERSLQTLEWLYARPLSSGRIFAGRALAIAVAAFAWSALALAVHRVELSELDQALSTMAGLPGPLVLYVVQLALALGCGLLSSALTSSTESSFRASVLILVGAWLAALVPGRMVAHAGVLLASSRQGYSYYLDAVTAGFLLVVAGVLLVASWRAAAEAPADAARARRSAIPGGIAVGIAIVGLVAALHLPRLAGREYRGALWLGGDTALTFAPARGMAAAGGNTALVVHPIVRGASGATVLRDLFATRYEMSSARVSAERGAAMLHSILPQSPGLPQAPDRAWVLLEADGSVHSGPLPPMGTSHAIGWSPSGERFAWKWVPWQPADTGQIGGRERPARLVVLDSDRSLRTLDLPPALDPESPKASPVLDAGSSWSWRAAWIDDRHLLLTNAGTSGSYERRSWWSTLDIDDPRGGEIHPLPIGQSLTAPALHSWAEGNSSLPTLDGEWVAVLADVDGESLYPHSQDELPAPPRLVRADPHDPRQLVLGPEIDTDTLTLSMGNLDDGSLVWAAPERTSTTLPRWAAGKETRIFRLSSFDSTPQVLCTAPNSRLMHFLGQAAPWAVWDTIHFARYEYELWGCNVATGEARVMSEWTPWAHSQAAITDRGLWTAAGWAPVADSSARTDGAR